MQFRWPVIPALLFGAIGIWTLFFAVVQLSLSRPLASFAGLLVPVAFSLAAFFSWRSRWLNVLISVLAGQALSGVSFALSW